MLKATANLHLVRAYLVQLPTTALCLLYVFVFFSGDWNPSDDFSMLVLAAVAIKCGLKGRAEPLDFALTVGLFYLFVMPCISLAFFGFYDYVIVTAMSSPIFDFIALASRKATFAPIRRGTTGRVTSLDYLAWCGLVSCLFFASAILPSGEIPRQLSFNFPFALSLIIFERVCRTAGNRRVYLLIGGYLLAITFYVNVYWSGFGRIVIGSYILIPLFIAHYWRDIGLRVWQAVIVAPVAIYVANLSRYQEAASFADMHSGSIAAHLVLTRDLMNQMDFSAPVGWAGFWEQWMLLFLQWFPRELWPDKPLGVGRGYVDMGLLGEDVSEHHSVALGYIGEAVLYLGNAAPLGLIITIATLVLARHLVGRVAQGHVAPVLAYDVFLITYIWAGTASFGGRMSFFVLPMLAFILLRRCRVRPDDGAGVSDTPLVSPHRARAPR